MSKNTKKYTKTIFGDQNHIQSLIVIQLEASEDSVVASQKGHGFKIQRTSKNFVYFSTPINIILYKHINRMSIFLLNEVSYIRSPSLDLDDY